MAVAEQARPRHSMSPEWVWCELREERRGSAYANLMPLAVELYELQERKSEDDA